MPDSPRSLCAFVIVLPIAAFGLNWPWEMVQMPAYTELASVSWRDTVRICTVATLGDATITLGIYGVGALATGRLRWGLEKAWNVYATAALLGGACATAIEWRALAFGRWSYSDRMPIVPVLGVGLCPLLQLILLVPAAMWLAAWRTRRSRP